MTEDSNAADNLSPETSPQMPQLDTMPEKQSPKRLTSQPLTFSAPAPDAGNAHGKRSPSRDIPRTLYISRRGRDATHPFTSSTRPIWAFFFFFTYTYIYLHILMILIILIILVLRCAYAHLACTCLYPLLPAYTRIFLVFLV